MDGVKTILEEAKEIVVDRKDEDNRQYGEFNVGMKRAALIFAGMTGREIDVKDMYAALIALKLSRQSFNHKRDNLLDACGYLQGLDDYHNKVTRGE
jgi:hypothetical protein